MIEMEIDVSVKLTCGCNHTLTLTNKGEIYAWGDNNYGQIGINEELTHSGPIMVTHGLLMKNFLIITMMSETPHSTKSSKSTTKTGHSQIAKCNEVAVMLPIIVEATNFNKLETR